VGCSDRRKCGVSEAKGMGRCGQSDECRDVVWVVCAKSVK
jgi:hypothetical protein